MTTPTLDDYRNLGRDGGLATGLIAVLDGLDLATAAPGGVAAVPATDPPDGASVVPYRLAAREGISVVRFSPGGTGAGLIGWRAAALAAVRIGVLTRMLALAVEHLSGRTFGGRPLIEQQMVVASVADVVTEIEAASAALPADGAASADGALPVADAASADRAARRVMWARHERVTEAGWAVTKLFGAAGYIADHPVRSLYVSALVTDVWIGRP